MARNGLYITPSEFVEFKRENLMMEVATRQRRQDFFGFTQFLPNPDPVLKKQGKDITAYREILVDAHLGGCVDTRKANVQALEWSIDRGKTKSRQAKVLAEIFDRLDMERIINEILDAPFYGYQPMELLYEMRGGWLGLSDIVGKPQEWFGFDEENRPVFFSREHSLRGEQVSPEKILMVRQHPAYNNPYGFPVLSRCFWPAVFKKGGIKFWVTFTEKYGMPWVDASYPDGWIKDQDRIDEFYDSVDSMVQDALIVLPQSAKLNVTPTGGVASVEIYDRLCARMDAEMSKAIFGHGAAADSTSGRLGNEEVAADSVASKKASDQKLVAGFFNRVLRTLTTLNFGESAVAPKFIFFEQEDVDLKLAERDEKLYAQGWRGSSKYYQREYLFEEGDFTLEHETAEGGNEDGGSRMETPPAEFAETSTPAAPDPVQVIAGQLSPEQLQLQMERALKPVFGLVAGASDYSEALEKLNATYPTMNTTDLEAVLARAIFIAETVGRLEADREASEE